jgi:hypothetical protein
MIEKKDVSKYLIIVLVFSGLIGVLFVFQGGPTGYAVYTDMGGGQITLTLQDADSDNLGDARVYGSFNIRNYGLSEELYVKWGSPKYNSYLTFNLSAVPSGQIIDSSKLCLYLFNDQASQTISAYHVYSDWNEGSLDNEVCGDNCEVTQNITWDNQLCGISFDNFTNCNLTAESSLSNDGAQDGTWQCWNVSNMVNYEYNSNNNSVSIALHTEDNGNADIFYSKEYTTDSSLIPYLNITYHTANTAPILSLALPQEGASYGYNESLALNFSVSDADSNLDSCWYNLNDGANLTLASCANTTFDVAEGSHTLNIYANDTLGLEVSDSASFNVAVGAPTITLNYPIDIYFSSGNNIEFNYTPTDVDLDSCWLLGDFGGVYGTNQTDTSATSGVINSFSLSLNDGTYLWNVGCNDSVGNSAVNGNKTFYVDSAIPSLSLTEPTGSKTSRTGIALEFSVSDDSPLTCYYNITTSIGTDIVNDVEVSDCLDTTFDVSADGDYIIYLWAVDSAENLNNVSSSFSVDTSTTPVSPPSGGGGGGGGGGGSPGIVSNQTGRVGVSSIGGIISHKGDEKSFILDVKNTGRVFLNKCKLIVSGEISSWISSSQVEGIAPGQNVDFGFDLKVPDEIESKNYLGGLEIRCDEGSNKQEISVSIPKGLVEIKKIVNENDLLNINYVFDNVFLGEEIRMEIWINDENGNELKRISDVFTSEELLVKRDISMELPKNLVGIYSIYFALESDLEDFVKQSVVLGQSSSTTGFAVFNTFKGEMAAYSIFVLVIILGIFLIWKRNKKDNPHTKKASSHLFLRNKK